MRQELCRRVNFPYPILPPADTTTNCFAKWAFVSYKDERITRNGFYTLILILRILFFFLSTQRYRLSQKHVVPMYVSECRR